MTKSFIVEMRTTGREVYYVVADSEEEAQENWVDGELIVSEVLDSEVYTVKEETP